MDDLLPRPPGGPSPLPEPTEHLDPFLQRSLERRPWEVRAAQWRAWALAEGAFGKGVQVRLSGRGVHEGFRGLLTLVVPFSSLGEHRIRESIFLSWARSDPVITRVPLLFVFEPGNAPG